ncbi:MAG: hypothetical protein WCI73_12380, partial [Phycisphaerae bacterium]
PVIVVAKLYLIPDDTDTLPARHPLEVAQDAIHRTVERGVPSIADHAHAQKVCAMGRRFMEIKARYPKIGRYIPVYHPDLQGPMDVCELLWGTDIFTDLFDVPELVHACLQLVTDVYIQYLRLWTTICPFSADGFGYHWGLLHKGHIMLRDDSAMNLSPDMFREFIHPYDQRLLTEFGGGAIHACGRVDHFAPLLPEFTGLYAFNLSQPHLNNMETIYQSTIDRGIQLIGFTSLAAYQSALAAGRNLHGRVQN